MDTQRLKERKVCVKYYLVCGIVCFLDSAWGQIRYSIPEELEHGAFVGNIAEDLGLDLEKLSARRFRIVSGTRRQYVEVNLENGVLFVNEKLDREELCEQSLACSFHLQVVIENPLELYRVEVEILDVNDNSPSFPWTEFNLDISESAAPGSRFPLESAQDLDVASNSLRTYLLSVNEHFTLDIQTRSDGSKFAELVLQKPLDREQQSAHQMVLTAVDGGSPERSGTAQIDITVLDANDNAPVFDQSFYRVRLAENAPKGSVVIKLNASDLDEGTNADIIYSFSGHAPIKVRQLFLVDARTGEIKVKGLIDYEKARMHEIYIQAKDKGPSAVAVHCKVLVNVLDQNDNLPEVILTSVSTPVHEDAPPGTVIAVISVTDKDSGENGKVDCEIPNLIPFQLHSSFQNYYTLVTSDFLDREAMAEYNITLTARDMGSPPLFTRKTIVVQVSDVNDNAPLFKQPSYTVYLTENNAPGASICSVTAQDPDYGQNAYLSYSIIEDDIQKMPASTYVSINSDNGNIYALRSFDHEQLKNFQITVQAQDAGFPPLSGNVTVTVFILDQNDNAPVILSPLPKNGTPPMEAVPRSVDAGYLITKIRAADADAGQNSRLFYQMLQATDPSLFSVALYTGEIRTIRQLVEKDPTRHRLVILVKDNGQLPLSATVSIILSVVDSLPESQPDWGDLSLSPRHSSNFSLYLIVSLGAVSLTFLVAIIVIVSVRKLKDRVSNRESNFPSANMCCCCCRSVSSDSDLFKKTNLNIRMSADAVGCTEVSSNSALPQAYCYKMCLTQESSKSDFMFLKPCSPVLSVRQNNTKSSDYMTSGWSALERNHLANNRTSTPKELKNSSKDWTWTKNQRNSAYKSSGNMESTLSRPQQFDADEYFCSVAPQYWTWGTHMSDCKTSLQDENNQNFPWTPKRNQPQTDVVDDQHRVYIPSEAPDYQHNVYIPGTTSGYSTLKLAPRGDLDVYNTFSTFGKKKKLISKYEQPYEKDDGFISSGIFK
ncbi:protocadherin beta-15-like isoform X2 [Corythoichthys intestinalis]|uniref:protocadherin beta-15-like isoform X2 n=1 Tax=Corythoichthys intestinalis TaxID=161448 RepID=UPI0025A614C6|nr:protocadherin beta-15-like isoform X2 [Corythoichthys intestinalis]